MNQTVCDACGKFQEGPYFPTAWYFVEHPTYGGEVRYDFCSVECMSIWAKRQLEKS